MTIYEAIMWLDENHRESMIATLEKIDGFDVSDYVLTKISDACKVACSIMHKYLLVEEALRES